MVNASYGTTGPSYPNRLPPTAGQYDGSGHAADANSPAYNSGGYAAAHTPGYSGAYEHPPARMGSGQHSMLRSGALKAQSSWLNVYELILIPWMFMALILSCFLFAGDQQRYVLWVVPVVLISLTCTFIYFRYKRGKTGEVVLGLLVLTAILAGLVVGAYANAKSLLEYWRLGRGATYFNVSPEESAGAKSDAMALNFVLGVRVDDSMTYGFVDGHDADGTIYCVAPISSGNSASIRIQYWAVGVNCCFPRNAFHCGEASNADAHGAIVLPQNVRENPLFKSAIEGAQAAYGVQSGDNYLFVTWKADPVNYRDSLWASTRKMFLVFGGVYLLLSAMVGWALMPVLKQ